MFTRLFRSCSSCNRPELPDWLIALAMLFIACVAILLAWLAFTTIFS